VSKQKVGGGGGGNCEKPVQGWPWLRSAPAEAGDGGEVVGPDPPSPGRQGQGSEGSVLRGETVAAAHVPPGRRRGSPIPTGMHPSPQLCHLARQGPHTPPLHQLGMTPRSSELPPGAAPPSPCSPRWGVPVPAPSPFTQAQHPPCTTEQPGASPHPSSSQPSTAPSRGDREKIRLETVLVIDTTK